MKQSVMLALLKNFCEVNCVPDKTTDSLAYFYCKVLTPYPDSIVINSIEYLMENWEKNYMPKVKTIKERCQEMYLRKIEDDNLKSLYSPSEDEKAFKLFLSKHKNELANIAVKIKTPGALNKKEKEALSVVSPYMELWGEDWFLKVSSKPEEKSDPLTSSFLGLYIKALNGSLKKTKSNSSGNLELNLTNMTKPQKIEKRKSDYDAF